MKKKRKKVKLIIFDAEIRKKIGRNEKCPCGLVKNLNIVMVKFNLNFLKSF